MYDDARDVSFDAHGRKSLHNSVTYSSSQMRAVKSGTEEDPKLIQTAHFQISSTL